MYDEIIDKATIKEYKKQIFLVIVTATQIETEELHKLLLPFQNKTRLQQITKDSYTYTIGIFGKYAIAHVQCEMGSIGPKSSTVTCSISFKLWKPKAIIMVGIAFGINKRKQRIGDIIISSTIIPYEKERIGKEINISRAAPMSCGQILLDRARNISSCNFEIPEKNGIVTRQPKIKIGEILSGEKLIDNEEFKINLLKIKPDAIGGEMEGAGLASFANSHKIEWLLIKGVCDFADGKKKENKDRYQQIAATSACKYLLQLLSVDKIYLDLNIRAFVEKKHLNIDQQSANEKGDVLFEIYSKESAAHYIVRNIDKAIKSKLDHYSLWLSGGTGLGKTSAAFKCSLDQKHDVFIAVGLANSLNSNILSLYSEFYNQLCLKFSMEFPTKKFKSLTEAYSKIYDLVIQKIGIKSCIILIDEIPVNNTSSKSFVDSIYAMISHLKSDPKLLKIKLIISTFFEPTCHITRSQQKIKEGIKFYHLDKWNESDIRRLILLICKKLKLQITGKEIDILIQVADGSPRFVKKVFKDYLINKTDRTYSLNRIIEETIQELK